MDNPLLGGSPGCNFLGTITIVLAQCGAFPTIMIAFLNFYSFCTHETCYKGKVYIFCEIGGLYPVSMSMVTNLAFLMSDEYRVNKSCYCVHSSLSCCLHSSSTVTSL